MVKSKLVDFLKKKKKLNAWSHNCVSVIFRFPIHRNILAAANVYFRALFTTQLKERGQEEISIKEVDGEPLQQLVEYCYIGKISIDSTNVDELTKAATMLQFPEVKDNCAEFYSTMLTVSSCLGIEMIADRHNMVQLRGMARGFILDHFVEVSMSDEFVLLDVEYLSALLQDDGINITSEEDTFNAMMRWVKADVNNDNRKQWLESLLDCVRFKYVKQSVSYSTNIIEFCKMLRSFSLGSSSC